MSGPVAAIQSAGDRVGLGTSVACSVWTDLPPSTLQAITYDPDLFFRDHGLQYARHLEERLVLGVALTDDGAVGDGRGGPSWEEG